jgi:tryptophan halogenase
MIELRKCVVVGSGVEAWTVAAGLRRAFRTRPLEVCIVPTGDPAISRVGRWTLPSQRGMHALLGIAEPECMAQCGATFKLASEHLGWQGKGSRFLHAHGEIGADIGGAPFYKVILREALAGQPHPAETFSLAGTAARLGRFARPMGESKAITAGFTYGFHLDEAAYAKYLRAHALGLGVIEATAPLIDLQLDADGAIESLRLSDGTTIGGDYFLDCSGPGANLLTRIAPDDREDWSRWLPCDRMWSARGPAITEPAPITQTTAMTAGWAWRAPLAGASMVGFVYSSRFQDDDAARAALQSFEPRLSEPVFARFSSGRRRRPWVRNVVALGQAAVELEPLAGADLHMAQIGLATFIELFPLSRSSAIEAQEYNRLMAEYAGALRDFTLAHYVAGVGRRGDFWDAIRSEAPPARLAHKLDHYAASGRIDLLDFETFEETDWAWLLIGSGRVPDALELQIRLQLEKIPPQALNGLRAHVQQVAATMPTHAEFLRRMVMRPKP